MKTFLSPDSSTEQRCAVLGAEFQQRLSGDFGGGDCATNLPHSAFATPTPARILSVKPVNPLDADPSRPHEMIVQTELTDNSGSKIKFSVDMEGGEWRIDAFPSS